MATLEALKQIISQETRNRVDVNTIPEDDELSDHGVDSLDMSSILLTIEETFGVHIPDSETPKLTTLRSLLDFINDNSR